jgi:8-oxo-dGTP pyrophosphatase MutT (NUDIX family)
MKLSDIDRRGPHKETNLVFLRRDGEILLAMKKRGFGAGRWNGAGGKVEPGESVEEAAQREVREEIGVDACSLAEVARLMFYFVDGAKGADGVKSPGKPIRCTVYVCEGWDGEPIETEEMAPQWYPIDSVPYDSMWPDDRMWLPQVLAGQCVEAEFLFGEGDEVLDARVDERV